MAPNPGYTRDLGPAPNQPPRDSLLRPSTQPTTLTRSTSARASTAPSRQPLRSLFSRQHTPPPPPQRLPETLSEKPLVQHGTAPYAYPRSKSTTTADNFRSQQQKLASLFQRARSQTLSRQSVSRPFGSVDHLERPAPSAMNKTVTTTTDPPVIHRSQTQQTQPPYTRNEDSESGNRYPSSQKPESAVKATPPKSPIDSVQGSTIEERIRFIRAKAEETRLELLALEQLEKDMCQQAGREAKEIGGQPTHTSGNALTSSTPPIRQCTKAGSSAATRTGISRHSPRTPSPLSMSFAPTEELVTRQGPTSDHSGDSFSSVDRKIKPEKARYVVETDPLSPSPPDIDTSSPPVSPLECGDLSASCSSLESGNGGGNRRTFVSRAQRISISHAQANIASVAALKRQTDTTRERRGWTPTSNRLIKNTTNSHFDDDDDEGILDSYLDEYQEDLRDTTISDMMRQHLVLLSDSDENSEGRDTGSTGTPSDSAKSANSNGKESRIPEADLTFADRTGYFMSMLESDYDQQAGLSPGSSIESVPMLLSESLPEVQDDADFSFIGQDSANFQSPRQASINQRALPSPQSQRILLNTTSTSKGSVLEDFLRPNPRASRLGSPLDRSEPLILPPPPQQRQSDSRQKLVQAPPPPGPTSNPTPSRILNCASSSSRSWANRVKPIPAPIITSHEYCRQASQRRTGPIDEIQRPVLPHPSSQGVVKGVEPTKGPFSPVVPRPLSSVIPGPSKSPTSPWGEFQTPLTSRAPDSNDITGMESDGSSDNSASYESPATTPLSVYNSAKEEFSIGSMSFREKELKDLSCLQDSKKHTVSSQGSSAATVPFVPVPTPFGNIAPAREGTSSFPSSVKCQKRQPLDMIIVRPTRTPEVCATPEDPVSSVGSSTSSSSWTWSWPSSASSNCKVSTLSTVTNSDGEEDALIPHRPGYVPGAQQKLQPHGIKIKSRSMSSLVKHQNGWLGFMALDVRLVASGRNHIVVVTHSNQIYSCWESHDNDLGSDGSNTTRTTDPKKKIESDKTSIEFILGRKTMTDNGAGFVQDTTLQPGLVQTERETFVVGSKVIKVVCSDWATFLLTERGDLWGWGFFEDNHGRRAGILSRSGLQTTARPIQIFPQRIIDVACGNNHVLILNASRMVLSWGANDQGQLGRPTQPPSSQLSHAHSTALPLVPTPDLTGTEKEMDTTPYFIEGLSQNILGIGSGKRFSFAWDEEKLYGWGDNSSGQLGRLVLPSLNSSPNIAASAASAASTLTSSNSSSALSTLSSSSSSSSSPMDRFRARYNSRYGLRDTIVKRPHPIQLHWKGSSIKQISGGRDHTVILTHSGLIITMGSDEYGQLGLAPRSGAGPVSGPGPGSGVRSRQPKGTGNELDRRQIYKSTLSRSASMSSHLTSMSSSSSSSSTSTNGSTFHSSPRSWWSRLTDSPATTSAGTDSEAAPKSTTFTGSASSLLSDQSPLQNKVVGQESGHGSHTNNHIRLYPSLVKVGPGIQQISCGEFHTACFTDNGEMWTWGQGYDGLVVIQSKSGLIHWETFCQERPSQWKEGNPPALHNINNSSNSNSNRMLGYGGSSDEGRDTQLRRRIVTISTMSQGVSIALVSND